MEKKKLNLKKIKIAKLSQSSLTKKSLENIKGGEDSCIASIIKFVTIGGNETYDTRSSCYSRRPETDCIGS